MSSSDESSPRHRSSTGAGWVRPAFQIWTSPGDSLNEVVPFTDSHFPASQRRLGSDIILPFLTVGSRASRRMVILEQTSGNCPAVTLCGQFHGVECSHETPGPA